MAQVARLQERRLIRISGEDWRSFLQGLITQDVLSLEPDEIRFAALLTPQGRLQFDMFVIGLEDGAWLDVEAAGREALIQRLMLHRLRAKVQIAPDPTPVSVLFNSDSAPPGWLRDPRLPGLGWRGYGAEAPAELVQPAVYDRHQRALGAPTPGDWAGETVYPIEANFDLLNGIDFHKGCFLGQETTSRMKRRGQIKSRMLPIVFDGPPPPQGAEVLAGDLRAGVALTGDAGRSMALLRLDRIGGSLTLEGRPVTVERPAWIEPRSEDPETDVAG